MDRAIWRPPRLRTLETDERSATWTELFYDLVFVVAVARLGARFLHDLTWEGFFEFAALFTVLWWAWASFTFFADRYDTDDSGQRLLAVAQMIGVAGMAAAIGLGDQELDTISRPFAVSYAAVRIALVVMYARAYRHVPDTQPLVVGYLKGFSVEVLFWIASIFVPAPWRYLLWAAGLAVSFATPWLMRREQVRVPLSVSHLPERFGLFTILVLGESIAAVVAGVEDEEWALASSSVGVAGVVMATSLWWVYFDNLEGSVVRRDPNREHDWHPTAWIFSHLPLVIALTMAGIGVEELVIASAGHDFEAAHRWLAVAGVGGAYLAMAMILVSSSSADGRDHFHRKALIRLGAVVLVLILGAAGSDLEPVAFAVILAVIAGLQVAVDICEHWWSRRGAPSETPVAAEPEVTAPVVIANAERSATDDVHAP